jgi:hypothetical protein
MTESQRYISPRTKLNEMKTGHFHKIFLARGRDYAGNSYRDPTPLYMDIAIPRSKHIHSGRRQLFSFVRLPVKNIPISLVQLVVAQMGVALGHGNILMTRQFLSQL